MPVITLSREFGAGGLAVGQRLAEMLHLEFLDAAIIHEVARRLRVPDEVVQRWDERREGLILRLLRALQAAHPEYAPAAAVPEEILEGSADAERVWGVTVDVIREQAHEGNAVIVGRGGAFILVGWPGAHHFRLVAPREARIRRVAGRHGISEPEATRLLEEAERDRPRFIRHRFGVDVADPLHFALVLNTEVLGIEQTARLIAQVVREGPD